MASHGIWHMPQAIPWTPMANPLSQPSTLIHLFIKEFSLRAYSELGTGDVE